jgi:uncharacterized protein (UPF0276 family)
MGTSATTATKHMLTRASAGLNLCHENAEEIWRERPGLDFLQVHPEHLLQGQGGVYRDQLDDLSDHYALTYHGFGLSLGSIATLDKNYLHLVRRLLKDHPESFFSDHVSWSSLSQHHFHDLLPIIYSDETADYLIDRIQQVQECIDAPLYIENISSFMRFRESTKSEFEFINEVTKRSGCHLLLDLNNLYTNAMNFGESPEEVLREIRSDSVRSYHMAGCTCQTEKHGNVWIDYHKEPVHDEVWQLFESALDLFGTWPTLLEWENDVPPLSRTLQEVNKAKKLIKASQKRDGLEGNH